MILMQKHIYQKEILKNRSVMINSNGKIASYYDKINMFDVKLEKKESHKPVFFITKT